VNYEGCKLCIRIDFLRIEFRIEWLLKVSTPSRFTVCAFKHRECLSAACARSAWKSDMSRLCSILPILLEKIDEMVAESQAWGRCTIGLPPCGFAAPTVDVLKGCFDQTFVRLLSFVCSWHRTASSGWRSFHHLRRFRILFEIERGSLPLFHQSSSSVKALSVHCLRHS
jgi:hypothetical protein